jgi:hypothetical protein
MPFSTNIANQEATKINKSIDTYRNQNLGKKQQARFFHTTHNQYHKQCPLILVTRQLGTTSHTKREMCSRKSAITLVTQETSNSAGHVHQDFAGSLTFRIHPEIDKEALQTIFE